MLQSEEKLDIEIWYKVQYILFIEDCYG